MDELFEAVHECAAPRHDAASLQDDDDVVDAITRARDARSMSSDRRRAAQLPFWPALMTTAEAKPTRAEKRELKKHGGAETPAEKAVRQRLQQRLGARVALKDKRGKGTFTVHYTSYEELDEIMRRMKA